MKHSQPYPRPDKEYEDSEQEDNFIYEDEYAREQKYPGRSEQW